MDPDYEINLNELKEKGYVIIKNFYKKNIIDIMRKIILQNMLKKKNMLVLGDRSGSKPDFMRDASFNELIPLLKLNDIHNLMKKIFKAPFHFCFHNDIGLNRIVNWHKDTLNNQYTIYQKTDIWNEYNGEKHEIYKFLIYLQDHTFDNHGLCVIEGSHIEPYINIDKKRIKQIHTSLGDIIIFDQRLTHRGQNEKYKYQQNNDRILVSLGFGKNNIFTKEFEEGTIKRQNDQNKMIKKL